VWDNNHHIQAWMPYISRLHNDDPSWHIYANSILFDTFERLVELLTTMIDLNMWDFIWFIPKNMVFFFFGKVWFFKFMCPLLSLIMSSQSWCKNSFKLKGLESYLWSNSRMFYMYTFLRNVRASQRRLGIPILEGFFYYMYKVIVFPFIT
jgi:hypothetical protein